MEFIAEPQVSNVFSTSVPQENVHPGFQCQLFIFGGRYYLAFIWIWMQLFLVIIACACWQPGAETRDRSYAVFSRLHMLL